MKQARIYGHLLYFQQIDPWSNHVKISLSYTWILGHQKNYYSAYKAHRFTLTKIPIVTKIRT